MSKRTVKDIETQIAELEKEKEQLQKQVVMDKFEPLIEVLSTTTLSVSQIKKLIKDAEANSNKNSKTKESKKTSSKPRKKMVIKDKTCVVCGEIFTPTSGVQKVCSKCKEKGLKPGDTTKESNKVNGSAIDYSKLVYETE